MCECVYRGYGVQRVLYGKEEDLVATVRVVSICWSGDSLRCGIIKVSLLAWLTEIKKYQQKLNNWT